MGSLIHIAKRGKPGLPRPHWESVLVSCAFLEGWKISCETLKKLWAGLISRSWTPAIRSLIPSWSVVYYTRGSSPWQDIRFQWYAFVSTCTRWSSICLRTRKMNAIQGDLQSRKNDIMWIAYLKVHCIRQSVFKCILLC